MSERVSERGKSTLQGGEAEDREAIFICLCGHLLTDAGLVCDEHLENRPHKKWLNLAIKNSTLSKYCGQLKVVLGLHSLESFYTLKWQI